METNARVIVGNWGHEYILQEDNSININGYEFGSESRYTHLRLPPEDGLTLAFAILERSGASTVAKLNDTINRLREDLRAKK